ncbi:MAG: short-chain dehydrogenase/reductase [Actinomycetia bacterium]|nr:short-chain dehydrogenase/reductase [Actinomycetes bacterium]
MDLGLDGKRAAVSAASKGLGFGVANALAAEGVHVAICGRDRETVDAAAARIGNGAVGLVADVSDPDGAAGFIREARDALGGLDIVVPNAGGPPGGNFASTRLEQYEAAFRLNGLSTIAMCYEAVPGLRQQGWGRIVAITSWTVRQPNPGLILSNTARAAVTGFLKTLAGEIAIDGITVNSLQPGSHATDRMKQLSGGDMTDATKSGIPTGQFGRPEDFGAVAAFLCSDHARFVNGAAIPVDGGSSAGLQ